MPRKRREDPENERKERRKAQNRKAATRCRERKMNRIKTAEKNLQIYQKYTEDLQTECHELRAELTRLQNSMTSHGFTENITQFKTIPTTQIPNFEGTHENKKSAEKIRRPVSELSDISLEEYHECSFESSDLEQYQVPIGNSNYYHPFPESSDWNTPIMNKTLNTLTLDCEDYHERSPMCFPSTSSYHSFVTSNNSPASCMIGNFTLEEIVTTEIIPTPTVIPAKKIIPVEVAIANFRDMNL